jgi:hypothetical protein
MTTPEPSASDKIFIRKQQLEMRQKICITSIIVMMKHFMNIHRKIIIMSTVA